MTRQEKLQEIGKMIPQEFMSYFVIPIEHNFFNNKRSFIEELKTSEWKIVNAEKGQERAFDAYNIKSYIYENVIPHLDNKNHILDNKNIILTKQLNIQCKFEQFKFTISDIDLWIFDSIVGFFVIKPEIEFREYTINQLTTFNHLLRQHKFLKFEKINEEFIVSRPRGYEQRNDILKFLFEQTKINKKSLLNIDFETCINSSIYHSSTNAKLMTAVQTSEMCFSNGEDIEPLHDTELHAVRINGTSILEEVPFYLASCLELLPSNSFTNNEEYIHARVDIGGFNVWKYSSGLVLHDSFAIVGLGEDGGPIVDNMKGNSYFIYILNLYLSFQLRYIEDYIIDDNFESLSIIETYEELQILKNKFLAKEIGTKFQENELHTIMLSAHKTEDIMSEVTDNLMETKEIVQNNIGIYISFLAFFLASIFEDSIKHLLKTHTIISISSLLFMIIIGFKYKKELKKLYRKVMKLL